MIHWYPYLLDGIGWLCRVTHGLSCRVLPF